jgi:hypothetical protein
MISCHQMRRQNRPAAKASGSLLDDSHALFFIFLIFFFIRRNLSPKIVKRFLALLQFP